MHVRKVWLLMAPQVVRVVQGFGKSQLLGHPRDDHWLVLVMYPPSWGYGILLPAWTPRSLGWAGPQGYTGWQVHFLWGGWAGLIHPWTGESRGCWWRSPPDLQTRANSPGSAAPSGSKASCMFGAGRAVESSSRGPDFCSSDEALSVGDGMSHRILLHHIQHRNI